MESMFHMVYLLCPHGDTYQLCNEFLRGCSHQNCSVAHLYNYLTNFPQVFWTANPAPAPTSRFQPAQKLPRARRPGAPG